MSIVMEFGTFLPWVQVHELYLNTSLALGGFEITYLYICRDASLMFP